MKRFFVVSLVFVYYCLAVWQPRWGLCPVLKAQTCLPAGITFSSQAAIDAFPVDFPACTTIAGTLTIQEASPGAIENLAGLSSIVSIGEALVINQNTALTSLEGLANLRTIGGRLTISSNPNLENLKGLEQLDTIGSSLRIANNNDLSALTSFPNLHYLLQDLNIENNRSLNNLKGLDSLRQIDGQVNIVANSRMTSLDGLSQLQVVGGIFQIYNNPVLQSLTGLSALKSVGDDFILDENQRLPTLQGLEALESVGGFLQIVNHRILNNLMGLRELRQISGLLQVYNNPVLSSLSGLDSIDHTSINSLALLTNRNLAECSIKSVCDYLADEDKIYAIKGNDASCNTREQILTACDRQGQNSQPGRSTDILLFPNPTKGNVSIKGRNIEGAKVVVFDTAGRKISTRLVTQQALDIGELAVGYYRLRIFHGDRVFNKSLMKID